MPARGWQFPIAVRQVLNCAKAGFSVTTKLTTGDVDGPKTAGLVGVNTAVSECDPTPNAVVVPDAVPLVTLTGLPRLAVPSLNCTVPTAVAGLTATVSVTWVPERTGEAGAVASAALVAVPPLAEPVITKITGGEVDGLKTVGVAGVNTAVSERDPAANVDVDPDAAPLLTATGLPRLAVPSMNCTTPTAVAGVIVAVSVTGVPGAAEEAGDVVSAVLVAVGPVTAVIMKAIGGDVDGAKAAEFVGVNTAVSERDPTANVDVDPDAAPLVTITGLPRLVVASLN